jgi:23S rRNA (adenine1618-N6)-methyltransferase
VNRVEPRGPDPKPGLHPRNAHRHGYDFPALTAAVPELGKHLRPSPTGTPTIDFADPVAVLALNRALLALHYGITTWSIPAGYLCPPVPGRADYIHAVADLLAAEHGGVVPRGPTVRGLDIGVGANAIYPIIGRATYGWSFTGTETDRAALASARRIVAANPVLQGGVDLKEQKRPGCIFEGVTTPGENFAFCLCNPPFHRSAAEALATTRRKNRTLHGRASDGRNFGGGAAELWCAGGEAGFIGRMIRESAGHPALCGWFTTLVSRADSLADLRQLLHRHATREVRVIDLAQGQKKSRILAWRF